jgi:peptide/nickel transport system ATP-binding protein/oligopeptide transport system ATP-binding protein
MITPTRSPLEITDPLLSVRDLAVSFQVEDSAATAVDGVSFDIAPGKTLALVGESGSGKSVTALSIMGLIPSSGGRVVNGTTHFDGRDLLQLSSSEMRAVRLNDISMIFQEPMTSLNPVFRIGTQLREVYQLYGGLNRNDAQDAAIEMLETVGIPDPKHRVDEYPHQLSGGMRQRVMIAIALACNPKLLIADEPTTALDVTIQAQILDLLQGLQDKFHMAILLITHDLGVVAEMADVVAVMYAGKIVDAALADPMFDSPEHPYTKGLFASLPSLEGPRERLDAIAGRVPSIQDMPDGCRFHTRCPLAMDRCKNDFPPFFQTSSAHASACWLHEVDTAKCPDS